MEEHSKSEGNTVQIILKLYISVTHLLGKLKANTPTTSVANSLGPSLEVTWSHTELL